MIYLFYYTARAHLCAPRTMLTGMSAFVPVAAPVVILAPVPPGFYCSICKLSLFSQALFDVHNRSVFHIMRMLKLHGLPMVKCVFCCSFALLPEDEHVALPRHVLAAARYPFFRGSPLLVACTPCICTPHFSLPSLPSIRITFVCTRSTFKPMTVSLPCLNVLLLKHG